MTFRLQLFALFVVNLRSTCASHDVSTVFYAKLSPVLLVVWRFEMGVFSKVGGYSHASLFRSFRKTSCPWTGYGRQRCATGDSRHTETSRIDQVESWDSEQGYDGIDIHRFKATNFEGEKPLHMKAGPDFLRSRSSLPAISRWFESESSIKEPGLNDKAMTPYLQSFSSTLILPFELAYPQPSKSGDTIQNFLQSLKVDGVHDPAAVLRELVQFEETRKEREQGTKRQGRVLRFDAPLALLEAARDFNLERPEAGLRSLYIAQALISDLPKELQDDLPVPMIVKLAGRGDIYSSSIWLGLEPTFTPLHRDPNPNLFIQMCSQKVFRLLSPASGDKLYRGVQSRLPQAVRANSRLRGLEMMHGPERDLLRKAVWDEQGLRSVPPSTSVAAVTDSSRSMMQEAHLAPGDALFIPKGWWHSVTSKDENSALNASVNWWFR